MHPLDDEVQPLLIPRSQIDRPDITVKRAGLIEEAHCAVAAPKPIERRAHHHATPRHFPILGIAGGNSSREPIVHR
ncbi:hypothetical protein ASE00_04840 [Sphingomonas sp. Root710]|nr:hypothetical protein ASE00_04840 [Sphingomonas sp. Root710]